jgi:hypothetical protein
MRALTVIRHRDGHERKGAMSQFQLEQLGSGSGVPVDGRQPSERGSKEAARTCAAAAHCEREVGSLLLCQGPWRSAQHRLIGSKVPLARAGLSALRRLSSAAAQEA